MVLNVRLTLKTVTLISVFNVSLSNVILYIDSKFHVNF